MPPEQTRDDDLPLLLDVLPPDVQSALASHPHRTSLIEIVLDLGRPPEARFPDHGDLLGDAPITADDIAHVTDRVGHFGPDNRAGIERTLHRISAIRNRAGDPVGLTLRVGRAVLGTIDIVRDVIEEGSSILLLGRPGVGKTTLLREAARVLADELGQRVVIVDTSNEIAGDGDIPHPGIGRARRMQVPAGVSQAQVMIEAVENHMPEVVVIDEIGTEAEAQAARTIAERGVQLIATAHGNSLENLLQNPTLSDLVGGIQAVTLSDDEARRRRTQKTVLERKAPPTFDVLIEIQAKGSLVVHRHVAEVVDRFLRGVAPQPERRTRGDDGEVEIEDAGPGGASGDDKTARNREATGAPGAGENRLPAENRRPSENPRPAEPRWPGAAEAASRDPGAPATGVAPGRTSRILRVFPYAVSRDKLERVVRKFKVPAYVVEDLAEADVILTTKGQERRQPRKLRDAQARGVPLHLVRSNTVTQMESFLRSAFDLAGAEAGRDAADGGDAAGRRRPRERGGNATGSEAAALREAQRGVEEVRSSRQPVELTPRNSYLRRLQHELAESHHLSSRSRGDGPYRRVVLYPG